MHVFRELASLVKGRLQRSRRRDRARREYRRLGIEPLEDRRVMSGLSLAALPPAICGPVAVAAAPAAAAATGGNQAGATLSPAQLAAEDNGRPVDQCLCGGPLQPDSGPAGRERQPLPFPAEHLHGLGDDLRRGRWRNRDPNGGRTALHARCQDAGRRFRQPARRPEQRRPGQVFALRGRCPLGPAGIPVPGPVPEPRAGRTTAAACSRSISPTPPKPPGRPSTTGSHKRPTTRSRT